MLSTTDKYESSNFIYFPTIAIFTFFTFSSLYFLSTFLKCSIIFSHSSFLGSIFSNFKCLHMLVAKPSFSSISGTSYKFDAVIFAITFSGLTLQNKAILFLIFSVIGNSVLHTNTSGLIPKD